MIFIAARFKVKPEYADDWIEHTRSFTEATRAEPGNLWFDWSRRVDDPNEYVLLEAFTDAGAEPHVNSDHFRHARTDLPPLLPDTPRVRNMQTDGDDGDELAALSLT